MSRNKTRTKLVNLLPIAALLVAWEIAAGISPKFSFVAASPIQIGWAFADLLRNGRLVNHFLITASEAGVGLALGIIAGTALGLMFWYSTRWAKALQPLVVVLGSVPLFAFAPLMILWFGVGWEMKTAMAFFSVVPVALNQSFRGAVSVSEEYLSVIRGLGASRPQTLGKVVAPGAANWVLNSLRISAGLALLGAFMGEFISSDRGLGHLILRASGLYDIPRALAAALGIVLLAAIFEGLGAFLQGNSDRIVEYLSVPKVVRKYGESRGPTFDST